MRWDSSKNYSQGDMLGMQQDALRRVREMQARAERTLHSANTDHSNFGATYNPPPPTPHGVSQSTPFIKENPEFRNGALGSNNSVFNGIVGGGGGLDSLLSTGSNLVSNVLSYFTGSKTEDGELSPIAAILDVLHMDKERLIVLGLLVVLMNEKADKTMLLALFYLLF